MDGSTVSSSRKITIRSENTIRRNRGWYLAQGLLFVVAALLAFVLPVVTVMAIELLLAALLIISGLYQAYQGISDGSGWMILSGALSLVVGVFMLVMPVAGAIALATLVAFFLFVEGIVEIVLALQMRFSRSWGWLLAAGILSLILSVILLVGWPEQTVTLVGIFLGLNFLFYGLAILAIVASVPKQSPD